MFKILLAGEKRFLDHLTPLAKSCGADILTASSFRDAVSANVAQKPGLIVTQERFADGSAEELILQVKRDSPAVLVILALAQRDVDQALRWMECGAYECLYEPIQAREVKVVLGGAIRTQTGTFFAGEKKQFPRLPNFLSLKFLSVVLAFVTVGLLLVWGVKVLQDRPSKSQSPQLQELPLSFRLPYQNPTGIAWDGRYLWVADWSVQTIYKHEVNSALSLKQYFPMSGIPIMSLAVGKDCLWTVGQDRRIRKHLIDGKLTMAAIFEVPNVAPSAIAWDGRYLWTCDAESRNIYKHLADDKLTVVATYNYPGKNPVGMAWIGKDLWIADEDSGRLFRLSYNDEVFTFMGNPQPGVHMPGTNKLSGLCFDGQNFWTVSEGSGLIFRHKMSDLKNG